jgi:hypothetical protein
MSDCQKNFDTHHDFMHNCTHAPATRVLEIQFSDAVSVVPNFRPASVDTIVMFIAVNLYKTVKTFELMRGIE